MRKPTLALVMVALISAGAVAAVSGAAQRSAMAATTKAAAKSWTPSRMPDGQPDLQGVWEEETEKESNSGEDDRALRVQHLVSSSFMASHGRSPPRRAPSRER
jgi:hypothetical protein